MERSPVEAFWELARFHAQLDSAPGYFGPTALETVPPPAWSFGAEPGEADAVPEKGNLSILLDGAGHPRALVEAVDVPDMPVVLERCRVVYQEG